MLLRRRKTYVRPGQTVTVQIPTNPTSQRLGIAGTTQQVTIGTRSAHLYLPGRVGVTKVHFHEAGIGYDQRTGGLYVDPACRARTQPATDKTMPQASVCTGHLVQALSAVRDMTPVVIAIDQVEHFAHTIGAVTNRAGRVVWIATGPPITCDQVGGLRDAPGDTLVALPGGIRTGGGTLMAAELALALAAQPPALPVLLTDPAGRVHAFPVIGLTRSRDRLVWLVAGEPLRRPPALMALLRDFT